MDPIHSALLAVIASDAGDTTQARHHLETARCHSRAAARRHRQVVEIAELVVAGAYARAEGLALVHVAEFPDDVGLLDRITRHQSAPTVNRRE